MSQNQIEQAGKKNDEAGANALGRLVTEIGRAAHAGWGPTARLLVLLVVAAAAVALVIVAAGG